MPSAELGSLGAPRVPSTGSLSISQTRKEGAAPLSQPTGRAEAQTHPSWNASCCPSRPLVPEASALLP